MDAEKWTKDVEALRRDLDRKREILKVVLDGTADMENTDSIINLFNLRSEIRMEDRRFSAHLQQTLAIDENTCWIIEVTSKMDDSRSISVCLLPPQNTRWKLFDREWEPLQAISPNFTATLVVVVKTIKILNDDLSIAVDLRSTNQFTDLERRKCETIIFKVPKAEKFLRLHEVNQYRLQEVQTMIHMLSVARFDREIPNLLSSDLQEIFGQKFNIIDYGSFKFCLGCDEFSTIFLYSVPSRGYKLCRLNASNEEIGESFIKILNEKLNNLDN